MRAQGKGSRIDQGAEKGDGRCRVFSREQRERAIFSFQQLALLTPGRCCRHCYAVPPGRKHGNPRQSTTGICTLVWVLVAGVASARYAGYSLMLHAPLVDLLIIFWELQLDRGASQSRAREFPSLTLLPLRAALGWWAVSLSRPSGETHELYRNVSMFKAFVCVMRCNLDGRAFACVQVLETEKFVTCSS